MKTYIYITKLYISIYNNNDYIYIQIMICIYKYMHLYRPKIKHYINHMFNQMESDYWHLICLFILGQLTPVHTWVMLFSPFILGQMFILPPPTCSYYNFSQLYIFSSDEMDHIAEMDHTGEFFQISRFFVDHTTNWNC